MVRTKYIKINNQLKENLAYSNKNMLKTISSITLVIHYTFHRYNYLSDILYNILVDN